MALSSISVSIENDYCNGCVRIESTRKASTLGDIAYVNVLRKRHGTNETYKKIIEVEIDSLNDLNFNVLDVTSRSGYTYDYAVETTDGNSTGYNVLESGYISNIQCVINGIYVGNDNEHYVAQLDCETSITRNTEVNYVNTLSSRTPYRVSNSNLNYTTGSSSGLFLEFDNKGEPIKSQNDLFTNQIIDFLCDGTDKILKTSNGGIWYVSIDSAVEVASDDHYSGHNIISFEWTEIDDVPELKKV